MAYADGEVAADGTVKRRRRRKSPNADELAKEDRSEATQLDTASLNEVEGIGEQQSGGRRSRRECPIPKPTGRVGELLGFKNERSVGGDGRPSL